MASLFEEIIFSRFKKFRKVCFEKVFISSKSPLFSSAAAFLLRSLLAGLKKKVSTPLILSAELALGAAFAWIEINISAFFLAAKAVRDRRFIKTSVLRV